MITDKVHGTRGGGKRPLETEPDPFDGKWWTMQRRTGVRGLILAGATAIAALGCSSDSGPTDQGGGGGGGPVGTVIVGNIFFESGHNGTSDPAQDTVAVGVLTQAAALGLILIMLGAIQKKIFVWHTGVWGKHGTDGWHYELMLVAMCLVIATTAGGRYVVI